MFLELKASSITFEVFLAQLKAKKTWIQLAQKAKAGQATLAADDELFALYQSLNKIKQDENLYQQMQQALKNGDKQKAADLISSNNFKAKLGSVVLNFEKIPYSSSNDLVKMALQYRRSLGKNMKQGQHAGSGSNVAVFEYVGLQGNIKHIVRMADDVGHAEMKIVDELEYLKILPKNVKRIYSELDSCKPCTKELKEKYSHVQGFYSFEFNDQGKLLWRKKINELYNFLKTKNKLR